MSPGTAAPPTIAWRTARATTRNCGEAIPYEGLAERLESMLRVIYLLILEGYATTEGLALTCADLCAEARTAYRKALALGAPGRRAPISGAAAFGAGRSVRAGPHRCVENASRAPEPQ